MIADLHGNLPALDAVLADLERVQPDAVVIAGDFVNRGPESHAVVARAMRLGFPAISGNHDTWLASLARGEDPPDDWQTPWWTPVRRAAQELTPADLAWIDALPATLRLELPGAAPALIVHGSPRHAREGMGRMLSDERLAEALAGVEERTIIGAHIHYPWDRWLGDRHAIVIGAVGCPFNGDTSAQYGLFTWRAGMWEFAHHAVAYDHEPLYAAWRRSGYLDDGGAAAALMLLEHQTARTQYVPFWEWASANGLPLSMDYYSDFSAQRRWSPPPPPPAARSRRAV